MKHFFFFIIFSLFFFSCQILYNKKAKSSSHAINAKPDKSIKPIASADTSNNNKVRPYKEIITSRAITQKGLFTIHKINERYFFEISDSLLGRDILIVNRVSKSGRGGYPGVLWVWWGSNRRKSNTV